MTQRSCLRRKRPVGALMLAIPVSAVALTASPADAQSRFRPAHSQHRTLEPPPSSGHSGRSRPRAALTPLTPLRTSLTSLAPARTPLTPLTPLAPVRTLTPHAPMTPRARATPDRPSASSGGAALGLRRALLSGDRATASSGGAAIPQTIYRQSIASWYEDAGSTACGFHARLGVANRELPCGTRVTFRYGARTVTAVVDDRGPYVGGRDWDFNQSTAAALGFSGVGTVQSSR